jgi:hypothetical protein
MQGGVGIPQSRGAAASLGQPLNEWRLRGGRRTPSVARHLRPAGPAALRPPPARGGSAAARRPAAAGKVGGRVVPPPHTQRRAGYIEWHAWEPKDQSSLLVAEVPAVPSGSAGT